MITAVTGCDNVEWGGAEVRMEPPPIRDVEPTPDEQREEAEPGPEERLPRGPVLYLAERFDGRARVVPVGEIAADSLRDFEGDLGSADYRSAFARRYLTPGSEFVLFAEGTRVGTLRADDVTTEEGFCPPRPAAEGMLEVVPDASRATRFLALSAEEAGDAPYGDFDAPEDTRGQRLMALELFRRRILELGAAWPTSLVEAREDMQSFSLGDDEPPAIAATFVVGDRLAVGPADPDSYALFLLATVQAGEYRPAWVWYRPAASEGKGAPRYFERMDWDGDGETEILLEVLGETGRWTAALDRRDGAWVRVHEGRCGARTRPATSQGG